MRALRALVLVLMLGLLPLPVAGQSADQDFLTGFLQDSLSSAGRQVRITGFQGALSSAASLQTLTIADEAGVWLTLRDVTLDWSRSALLSGKLTISDLSAGEIVLERLPAQQGGLAPEAGRLALPDLPIAIDITRIAVGHMVLGQAVLGQAAEGRLEASLRLAEGSGSLRLDLVRDGGGPEGRLLVEAGLDAATGGLTLALTAEEAAGGIVAGLLGLPGAPALRLTVQGQGAVAGGFQADVALDSDGVTRLAGRISTEARAGGTGFVADLAGDARQVLPPALATALGADLRLGLRGLWPGQEGGGKPETELTLAGTGYDLRMAGQWGDLASGLTFAGSLRGQIADLAPWSAASGLRLSGAAELDLAGSVTPLTGAADLAGRLTTRGLGLGVAVLDGLLAGAGALDLSLRRDDGGLTLRHLRLTAPGLAAELAGAVTSGGPALRGKLALDDLGRLGPGLGGRISGEGTLGGTLAAPEVRLTGQTRDLALGQTQADLLLAGPGRFALQLDLGAVGPVLRAAELTTGAMRLTASGLLQAQAQRLEISHRITDLALLLPGLPGALESTGTLQRDAAGVTLDLALRGPGRIAAQVAGRLEPDLSQAELTMSGTAQASVANALAAPRSLEGALRYDLRLKGPLTLSALSGTVDLAGGKLADPGQGFSLTDIAGRFTLAGGTAVLSAQALGAAGGTVDATGRIGLAAPYPADVDLRLEALGLRDPELYTTSLQGDLTLTGALAGGAVLAGSLDLGRTELRIPSTGIAPEGGLPGLRHKGEAQASRATRDRAGLLAGGTEAGGSGPGYGLNLRLRAPNQVFLRGRGLDAELGGTVLLTGRTTAVVPVGAFNLIRGRLEILGRRLALTEATLQLQGRIQPYLRIAAAVDSGGVAAQVRIEGPLDDPDVRFTATPDLPEEEVLARLLFDRGIENLTVFQVVQLASAVATLAGRSGTGAIDRLRGRIGVDNLDITTDAAGATAVTAGKYLSDKTYTEVTVAPGGGSSVTINLDLAPHVTLTGRLEDDGDTGIGLFLQRDY